MSEEQKKIQQQIAQIQLALVMHERGNGTITAQQAKALEAEMERLQKALNAR